jgi:hypothetical protein
MSGGVPSLRRSRLRVLKTVLVKGSAHINAYLPEQAGTLISHSERSKIRCVCSVSAARDVLKGPLWFRARNLARQLPDLRLFRMLSAPGFRVDGAVVPVLAQCRLA